MPTFRRRLLLLYQSGFTPLSISGLKVWLEARSGTFQDLGGTTPAGAGQTVARWNDLSGNGNNFTQGTGTARPTVSTFNSKTTLAFATNDTLTCATISGLSQPMTYYLITRQPTATANEYMMDGIDNSNRNAAFTFSSTTTQIFAGTGLTSSAAHDNTETLWIFIYNGASSFIYRNGTQIATGNAGTQVPAGLQIGARNGGSNFWNGDIRAYLAYTGNHDATTRTAVSAYLNAI